MQGNEVCTPQRIIEIGDGCTSCRANGLGRHIRIVDLDVHFHGQAALRNARANAPKANDEQRLVQELGGKQAIALGPTALPRNSVQVRALLAEPEHHQHRVLGDSGRVIRTARQQRNAAARQRLDVHSIVAHADAPNGAQLWRRLQVVCTHGRKGQCYSMHVGE